MRSSVAFLVLPLAIGASATCSAAPRFVQPVDHYVTPIREVQDTVIIAPSAPPPARVETIPPPPAATEFWRPGHWAWNNINWTWVPGEYIQRPSPQVAWQPGHWVEQPNGWMWVEGRWD